MKTQSKPTLAVTMGDPAGNGPEIIAKVVSEQVVQDLVNVVCIADATWLEKAFGIIGCSYPIRRIHTIEDAQFESGVLDVIDLENIEAERTVFGQVQASAGQAAFEYIVRAIDLALEGKVDAIVTSAINKESIHLAGHKYDGHAEILKLRTGSLAITGMLAAGDFRVTHVTTHVSLLDAVKQCKTKRILEVIRLTNHGLKQIGINEPKIGVAGLNPHSGEHGLFGNEETEEIQPALNLARKDGICVSDVPLPADTIFVRMWKHKEFDAVVAQYHDQGHIAAKLVDFFVGVNITLGLPIIRTSVDHGTSFDIAGSGKAKPDSLIAAIKYARRMVIHSSVAGDGQ